MEGPISSHHRGLGSPPKLTTFSCNMEHLCANFDNFYKNFGGKFGISNKSFAIICRTSNDNIIMLLSLLGYKWKCHPSGEVFFFLCVCVFVFFGGGGGSGTTCSNLRNISCFPAI